MVITGAKALEVWARRVTQGYPNVHIMNMTSSWKNGLAFCAILHKFRPDLLDFSSLMPDQIERNCELVFNIAEKELQIPALLDPQDMATCIKPDRLSILTYLAEFYHKFKDQEENRSNDTKLFSPKSVPSLRSKLESTSVTRAHVDANCEPKQDCDNINNNEDRKANDVDTADGSAVVVESRISTELSRKDSGDSGVSMTSPRVSCSSPPPSPGESCSSLLITLEASCSSPPPSPEESCSSPPPSPGASCSSLPPSPGVSCSSPPSSPGASFSSPSPSPEASCSSPPPSTGVSCSSLPITLEASCSTPQASTQLSCSSQLSSSEVSCSPPLSPGLSCTSQTSIEKVSSSTPISEVSCHSDSLPPTTSCSFLPSSQNLSVEVSSSFQTLMSNSDSAPATPSSHPPSSEVEDSTLASITFTDESDCVFSSLNIDSTSSLPTLPEETDSLHVASIAFTDDSDCVFSSFNDESISSLPKLTKEIESSHVASFAFIDESDNKFSSLSDVLPCPSAHKLSGNSVSINVNGSVPTSSIVTISVPPVTNLQSYNKTAKPYKSLLEEVPSKVKAKADNNSSVFITCDSSSSIVTCNSSLESLSSRIPSDKSSTESPTAEKEISSTIKHSKSVQRSSSGLNTLLKNVINKSNSLKNTEIEDYHSLPVHHESTMGHEPVKPSSPLAARINKYEFLSPQSNKSPRNDWVLKSMCSPTGEKFSKSFDLPKNNNIDINKATLLKSNVPENKFGSLNRVGRSCTNPGFQSIRDRFQRISLG